jgi:hypothetical protein
MNYFPNLFTNLNYYQPYFIPYEVNPYPTPQYLIGYNSYPDNQYNFNHESIIDICNVIKPSDKSINVLE